MKWWEVMPIGSILIALDTDEGRATFMSPDGRMAIYVDLFTDETEVVS